MNIPDEIYDDWLPLLGAMVIGVYGALCRLSERQASVVVGDLEPICLVHRQSLTLICRKLAVCGLVKVSHPEADAGAIIALLPLPPMATRGKPVLFGNAQLIPNDKET